MVAFLGGFVVILCVIVAGLWSTVRRERQQRTSAETRVDQLQKYVGELESNERREKLDADVPPRAVQYVVERADDAVYPVVDDGRTTDTDGFGVLDLAAMGNDRLTLT